MSVLRPASWVLRLAAAAAMLLLLTGCGAERRAAEERAVATAWWIEDRAHGLVREPGELALDGGGRHQAAVRERLVGPPPIRRFADRCARWPLLAPAVADGRLRPVEGGLLAPVPDGQGGLDPALTALADAENLDRRILDALVAGLLADTASDAFLAAAIHARGALDREPSAAAR